MPAKPGWFSRLDAALRELEASTSPWIGTGDIETLLQIGRRRAQQILAPLISQRIGPTGMADRQAVIRHLRALGSSDGAHYERQRRLAVAEELNRARRAKLTRPEILVEAPLAVLRQRLHDLPEGIELSAGRLTISFRSAEEALQKLLALAMAIGNDPAGFSERAEPTRESTVPL